MNTVSVAECATCGYLMAKFGSISGASSYYRGGINTYHIDQKVSILKVNREHAENFDCVSNKVVEEMALGVSKLFNTDIGISTSGYAEPYPKKQIYHTFIYCSIYDRRIDSYFTFVVHNDDNLSRKNFQKFVAKTVYDRFIEFYNIHKNIL